MGLLPLYTATQPSAHEVPRTTGCFSSPRVRYVPNRKGAALGNPGLYSKLQRNTPSNFRYSYFLLQAVWIPQSILRTCGPQFASLWPQKAQSLLSCAFACQTLRACAMHAPQSGDFKSLPQLYLLHPGLLAEGTW